jgi:hypothetical protein
VSCLTSIWRAGLNGFVATSAQRFVDRVGCTVTALLGLAEESPELARAVLPQLRDPQDALRRIVVAGIAAGGRSPDAVFPAGPAAAETVFDDALDVMAARLAGAGRPILADLARPMTAMLVLPYVGLADVAAAMRPATRTASVVPIAGASASTVRTGASATRSAARSRRTRSAQSSHAPAATAEETAGATAGATVVSARS